MQLSKIDGITKATTLDLDFAGIMELIATHGYSGSTFRNGHRCLDNFEQTNLVILDVDEDLSIDKAIQRLSGYKYILALTRNHQKVKVTKSGKEKAACDRFRIILFLNGIITRKEDYKNTCHQLLNIFPELDPSCSEASRFFYASTNIHSYSEAGRLVEIAEYIEPTARHTEPNLTGIIGNLSLKTEDFIANGAEVGTWNRRLFMAALDMNEQNYPKEEALAILNGVDNPLDESDMATFESAYERVPRHQPRVSHKEIKGFGDSGGTAPPPSNYEGLVIPFFKSNVRVWLDDLFDGNNISMNENGYFIVNKRRMAFDFFRHLIYISTGEAKRYKLDSKGQVVQNKFKEPVIISTAVAHRGIVDSYISKWLDEERGRIKQRTKDKLAYTGDNGEIAKYVSLIGSKDLELSEHIIRQFIYNVKVKMNEEHPEFIIMPVFSGPQGVGKSLAVQKLLEPIKYMTAPVNFDIFKDSREYKGTFGSKLVLEFDEMSAASKADIEAVKNKITAERVSYRELSTTQNTTLFNMASMIGSTNSTLVELLYDDTGKRRFYELTCKTQNFWKDIKQIDSIAMWQSVDVNGRPPIEDHLPKLIEVQSRYKNLNSAEEFLVDEDLIPDSGDDTFLIKRDELYKQYADAMALQKRRPYTRNNFYAKCRLLLEEKTTGSRIWNFVVRECK